MFFGDNYKRWEEQYAEYTRKFKKDLPNCDPVFEKCEHDESE